MQTGSKTWPFPAVFLARRRATDKATGRRPQKALDISFMWERELGLGGKPAYEGALVVGIQAVCPSLHNRASQEQGPNHEENQSAGPGERHRQEFVFLKAETKREVSE